ncbi:MAG: DNA mismatch repair protein [Lachnospiraceae bacterium]|nr:DNA mismatch repair protein [Lachnospiraceae bacterium]
MKKLSLLFPDRDDKKYKRLSETTVHDLGMDSIIDSLTDKKTEQVYIYNVMRLETADPDIVQYRCDVFDDIFHNKKMRDDIVDIMSRINFLKEYGSYIHDRDHDAGAFDLLHRLQEIGDYIESIEAIYKCLTDADIHSKGLLDLKKYVTDLFEDNGFEGMKKDVAALRADTSDLKSITVGINLNEAFEAQSIGVISLNNKPFTKSGIISNWVDKMSTKDQIHDRTDWDGSYHFEQFDAKPEGLSDNTTKALTAMVNPFAYASLACVPENDNSTRSVTNYMNQVTNHMLHRTIKHLKDVLNKYSMLTITDITDLMPEFIYYIRWAEYIEKLSQKGYSFARPQCSNEAMSAEGIYNIKLAALENHDAGHIITNDIDFSDEHRIYILTGANRGGKTTITQAVGQLFFMAEGGIYVPASQFYFTPVDAIYTHFPADEDKTMELGRLGEECQRFREIYKDSTKNSLLLLNETFSTTSFEEGYYIARDAVRAMLLKGCRVIYNTHMHKLAEDIDEMNQESKKYQAASLVVKSDGGNRSYKVEVAPPAGMSYAKDIAEKYGVTYEMLTKEGLKK